MPLTALLPDHPPEATHVVALLLDQVRVAEPPAGTVPGLALKLTAGGGVVTVTMTDCEAPPPGPVHIN